MATHSSVLAWRIPGMAEPGGLPSVGSHRVRHDWSDLATAAAAVANDVGQFFMCLFAIRGASQAVLVKRTRMPVQEKWERWVQYLGPEDPLEEGMATHSGTLAWKIPWAEEPGGLQSIGLNRVRHYWSDLACTHYHLCIFLRVSVQISCPFFMGLLSYNWIVNFLIYF